MSEFTSCEYTVGDRVQDQNTGMVGLVTDIFQRVGDEGDDESDFVLSIEDSDGQATLVRSQNAKRV